jgi:hypothetical protein
VLVSVATDYWAWRALAACANLPKALVVNPCPNGSALAWMSKTAI